MATETTTESATDVSTYRENAWQSGVLSGLIAGAVMGVMLTMQMRPVIEHAIPSLWGLDGGAAGWTIHMINSAIFGVLFAAMVSLTGLRSSADSVGKSAAIGVGYGVLVWVVAAVIVMPIWLQAVGFPMAPSLPNVSMQSLIGHVVFGAVLGALYPVIRNR
ncbi:histidine kinase [Haladaptatus pallidirubidus]|uniref:Histidine kinase n=1 Tax=Haladaptatus pallidirubidus TaxID=1008152 RepID=A0AAV3UL15_9EURY|nr:histidine kinase [Haladaptatus pallidirubidus]